MSGAPIDTSGWPKYGPDQTTFSHRPPSETCGTDLDNKTVGSLPGWIDPSTTDEHKYHLLGKYSQIWHTDKLDKITATTDGMGKAIFNALDDIRVTLDKIACDVRVLKIRGCEEPIGIVSRHCCPLDSLRKGLEDMAAAGKPPPPVPASPA